ncbi:MAG TPA: PAS domain S-box protein, partial [Vicinamibacteria bacterium]|nr:PAS domain S-box protein [Vicinamibacteria bacterium]
MNGAARGQDIHRQIFEKNLAVQLLIEPDTGRIVEANPAACAFYGYAREELIQRKITDINSLPVSEVHAAMGQATGERKNTFRFRHRLATGEIRDVEVHSGPIEVDGRRLLYSIIHDVTDSERTQAELHRTISLLQSTLDSTTDGILAIDRQGRIVSYNQRFAQMWRIPREVLETGDEEKAFAFSVGELRDPDQFRRKVQQVYAQPDLESFDVLEFNDGRVFERYSIPQMLDGKPVGRVWSFRDVTGRRRAEAALRESEASFRLLFANHPMPMWVYDLRDLRFLEVNESAVEHYGYSRDELLGMRITDLGPIEATEHSGESRHRRKDGTVIDVHMVSHVLEFAGRRAALVEAQDITERKRAEEALRESEERYRRLVEMSPDGIAIHSEGKVVFANPSALRTMRASRPEDLIGRAVLELVHPDDHAAVRRRLEILKRGEAVPFIEEKMLRLDGTPVEVEGQAMPFTYEDKPAVQVVMRDISARKRAEKLQRALYRIAEISASVEDMPGFYASVHQIVGDLMNARNFYLALQDEATSGLSFQYFVDEVDPDPPAVKAGKTLSEYVMRTGAPLLASPAVFERLVATGEVEVVGAPSVDWLGVPLMRGDRAFGVIVVQSYSEKARYTEEDRDILTFVAQHVAAALDRRRAADALRESEARFRTLAETAPCAIFIYQDDGFRYANPAAASITGFNRDELRDLSFWRLVHQDFREAVRERGLARQRGESVPARYEFKIERRDGEERWLDSSASSVEFGGRPAVLGIAFDVTERKRAEEQIKSLAYHDVLTGLPNRLLFNDRLNVAVA